MTKQKYLKKLSKALACLPREEREKALDYYNELIDDRVEAGFTEEAAINELGDVKTVAGDIIADARERGVKMRFTGGWKALGIIGVIIFVPALLFAAVALLSRFEPTAPFFDRMGGEWQERTAEYELAEGEGLTVDFGDYDLYVGVSEDGLVHVKYYENNIYKFDVSKTESGIDFRQLKKWHGLLFWIKPRQAEVLLPAGFSGDISLDVSTGDARLDNITTDGSMSLTASTGDIIAYDISAGAITASVSTGKCIIGRAYSEGDITVKNSTGDIELTNVTVGQEHGIYASCTTGDIKAADCTARSVELKLTTGQIDVDSVTADVFFAKSSTGDIKLDSLDAKDITLKATTGSIKGSLAGSIKDYSITSHVSTGNCNLPGELKLGDRKLSAEASTGNIEISFADDND